MELLRLNLIQVHQIEEFKKDFINLTGDTSAVMTIEMLESAGRVAPSLEVRVVSISQSQENLCAMEMSDLDCETSADTKLATI